MSTVLERESIREINGTPEGQSPRYNWTLVLPDVLVILGRRVRLGMHTDTIGNLVRILQDRYADADLVFQGRVLTEAQRKALEANPHYQFFMQGRVHRFIGEEVTNVLSLPRDTQLSTEAVNNLLDVTFSPSSLAHSIGFTTRYYDVGEILRMVAANKGNPNVLIPVFGGCNEVPMGSDTLRPFALGSVAIDIQERLRDMDLQARNRATMPLATLASVSSLYNLNSFGPKKNINPISKINFNQSLKNFNKIY